jgi:hypothetical protein
MDVSEQEEGEEVGVGGDDVGTIDPAAESIVKHCSLPIGVEWCIDSPEQSLVCDLNCTLVANVHNASEYGTMSCFRWGQCAQRLDGCCEYECVDTGETTVTSTPTTTGSITASSTQTTTPTTTQTSTPTSTMTNTALFEAKAAKQKSKAGVAVGVTIPLLLLMGGVGYVGHQRGMFGDVGGGGPSEAAYADADDADLVAADVGVSEI